MAGSPQALAIVPRRLPSGQYESRAAKAKIRLWDVMTATETDCLQVDADEISALCVLPDGRLASASICTIQLWDVHTGAETARLDFWGEQAGGIPALCVVRDGRLAMGASDDTIRLCEVKSQRAVQARN